MPRITKQILAVVQTVVEGDRLGAKYREAEITIFGDYRLVIRCELSNCAIDLFDRDGTHVQAYHGNDIFSVVVAITDLMSRAHTTTTIKEDDE